MLKFFKQTRCVSDKYFKGWAIQSTKVFYNLNQRFINKKANVENNLNLMLFDLFPLDIKLISNFFFRYLILGTETDHHKSAFYPRFCSFQHVFWHFLSFFKVATVTPSGMLCLSSAVEYFCFYFASPYSSNIPNTNKNLTFAL